MGYLVRLVSRPEYKHYQVRCEANMGILQEMTLEEAKEYFSKYTNADDRLAAWKEDTGYTEEAMKPAKKEAPAEKAEE